MENHKTETPSIYDPKSIIDNQFSDIYSGLDSTITKQYLLDQLEKKKQAAQRRPIMTGKKTCDMKMV